MRFFDGRAEDIPLKLLAVVKYFALTMFNRNFQFENENLVGRKTIVGFIFNAYSNLVLSCFCFLTGMALGCHLLLLGMHFSIYYISDGYLFL